MRPKRLTVGNCAYQNLTKIVWDALAGYFHTVHRQADDHNLEACTCHKMWYPYQTRIYGYLYKCICFDETKPFQCKQRNIPSRPVSLLSWKHITYQNYSCKGWRLLRPNNPAVIFMHLFDDTIGYSPRSRPSSIILSRRNVWIKYLCA